MKTNELIQELKIRTRSIKDRLKNVKYLHGILLGKVEPACCYGCTFAKNIPVKRSNDWHLMNLRLLEKKFNLENEIKTIGKTILILRGNKWSI